ncbi:unnamed protein product [Calicophoron daubneyi]|uniref:ANK_REP_REGION domain-containing protein n=1 Tax=Calicophoron daubneyi TaxID=300641 RepID=A0AAV2T3G9_CALDB
MDKDVSKLTNSIYSGQLTEVYKLNSEPTVAEYMNEVRSVDRCQKMNIELLTALGLKDYIEKAVDRGYDVKCAGVDGCTLLHHASMWNRTDLIKYLYFSDAELFAKNRQNETAHDLVSKYDQKEADYMLQWVECRQEFLALLQQTRTILASLGKSEFSKEEKKVAEAACADGEIWVQKNRDASLDAIRTKKEHIELIVEPFFREKLRS